MRTNTVRDLAMRADVIVVVRPIQRPVTEHVPVTGHTPRNRKPPSFLFVVKQVLRGRGLREGQPIQVLNDGYYAWDGFRIESDPFVNEKSGTGLTEIQEALLFLTADRIDANSDADYRMLFSGIRLLTSDGRTLVPTQISIPGDYYFVESCKVSVFPFSEGNFQSLIKTLQSERSTLDLAHRMYSGDWFRARPTDWLHANNDVSPLTIAFSEDGNGSESNAQEDLPPVQPQAD